MITGVALLGTLAGSLASFFRLGNGASSDGEPPTTATMPNDAALAALATEMTALRHQVEALTERLARTPADPPQAAPPGGDASG
jgi:voltage-gated potassium channel